MKSKIQSYISSGYFFLGLTLVVLVILSTYIYFLRGLYTEKFDRDFFNDLYDHSQYNIAQSYRGINDASVYQVVGDRLIRKVSGVFNVDPQVPPLGKIIIGISINTFGNGYIQNLISFTFLLIGVFLLGWQVLDSNIKRGVFVLLVLSDSIIVSQLKTTMLDLMSVLLIVWFCNFFVFSQIKNRNYYVTVIGGLLSGLMLGILASIKFGLIVPVLIFAAIIWKFIPSSFISIKELRRGIKKNLKLSIPPLIYLVTGIFVGFILGHSSYFFEKSSSIIDFLKNEKWVISYWLSASNTAQNRLVIIISIFTGLYKHFTSGSEWQWIFTDWNPLWALGFASWVMLVIKYFKNKLYIRKEVIFVFFVMLSIILVYSVTPFYFRYITHISPFLLLGIMFFPFEKFSFIKNKLAILTTVIVLLLCIKNVFLIFEQPSGIIQDYERLTKLKLYKDVYEKLEPGIKLRINYHSFWDTIYSAEYGLGKHDVKLIKLGNPKITMPWENRIVVPYKKIYMTKLGDIKVYYNLELVRVGHNWRIKWKDDYIHPNYSFGDKFVAEYDMSVKYGALIDKTGIVKVKRQTQPYAIIYPDKITDEANVISFFERYMGLSQFRLEEIYKVNLPSHLDAEVGYFPEPNTKMGDIPDGVEVVIMERWVGDSDGFNTDELGTQGGKIFLQKKNGSKKLILEKITIQGKDIYL